MPFEVQINTRESNNFQTPIQAVDFFSSIKLSLKYDSLFSSFQLEYLFDSSNEKDLEIAGITHYHEAIISYRRQDGSLQRVLTGFVLSQNFVDSPKPELLTIGGYSKPGVLEDCDIAANKDEIPSESVGLKVSDILKVICDFFKLESVISIPESESSTIQIKKSTSKIVENAASYIKRICVQKNIIMTHDEFGRVVMKKANTEKTPILEFDSDQSPNVGYEKMNLNFNGQGLYSPVAVFSQADDEGGNYSSFDVENPFVPISNSVVRFKAFEQTEGNDITVELAAKYELCKSLKNIVLTIDIVTETSKTEIVLPENIIIVKNSRLNMFDKVKWFVESVDIEQNPERTTQTLTCVLPWVYNLNAISADGKRSGPYNVFIKPGKNLPVQ